MFKLGNRTYSLQTCKKTEGYLFQVCMFLVIKQVKKNLVGSLKCKKLQMKKLLSILVFCLIRFNKNFSIEKLLDL